MPFRLAQIYRHLPDGQMLDFERQFICHWGHLRPRNIRGEGARGRSLGAGLNGRGGRDTYCPRI